MLASHEFTCGDRLCELALAASLVRRKPFVHSSCSGGSDGLSVTVNFRSRPKHTPRLRTISAGTPIIMASLQLIFATAMVPPPPVLLPGLNNVYGRAQYKKDSGVVRYLGQFNKTRECVSACLAYNGNGAQRCMSFTHHLPNMPTNWHGLCFGVVDHSWKPVPDTSSPPIITSGRVPWPEEGCGVGAPAGCTWQLDPWCLRSKYAERNLTTRAAAAACAADSKCLGFSFSASGPMANASSSSSPVPHSFFDTTGA
jgi:hypothetical protein